MRAREPERSGPHDYATPSPATSPRARNRLFLPTVGFALLALIAVGVWRLSATPDHTGAVHDRATALHAPSGIMTDASAH